MNAHDRILVNTTSPSCKKVGVDNNAKKIDRFFLLKSFLRYTLHVQQWVGMGGE